MGLPVFWIGDTIGRYPIGLAEKGDDDLLTVYLYTKLVCQKR
jgi:hypothetical protein